jgi:hypothetical protein
VLKKLALGLCAIVAILAAVVAVQPSEFRVERSAIVQAPAGVVYAHIQSLRAMDEWSPYAKMDPQMQIHYEGPEGGVGARSSWQGPQMGTGRLTITAVEPDRSVEMRLEMLTPMQADNRILFSLAPMGGATQVTWRMQGRNGLLGKAIGLVIGMDAMLGGQFEQGLASLEGVAEADAARRGAELAAQ